MQKHDFTMSDNDREIIFGKMNFFKFNHFECCIL